MPSLGLFIITRCITAPWIFACAGFSAVSDIELYLRAPLHSWGSFPFSISLTFLEGTPKWSENISNSYCTRCLDSFLPPGTLIILELSALVSGLLFYSALVWRVSLGSCLSQKVPCFIGYPKFLEGLLRACKRCPGNSYPCLIVSYFSDKRVILVSLT